jgi:hypothetical protein
MDKQYDVMTNVASAYPDEIINRLEWYKGFEIMYKLLPDGNIKTTKRYTDE